MDESYWHRSASNDNITPINTFLVEQITLPKRVAPHA
jgi:hypothetical protein